VKFDQGEMFVAPQRRNPAADEERLDVQASSRFCGL